MVPSHLVVERTGDTCQCFKGEEHAVVALVTTTSLPWLQMASTGGGGLSIHSNSIANRPIGSTTTFLLTLQALRRSSLCRKVFKVLVPVGEEVDLRLHSRVMTEKQIERQSNVCSKSSKCSIFASA
jgi:hypothetical protein